MLSLEGKNCIVTGASSGIGLAVARQLAQEKARICLVARSVEKLQAVSLELGQAGEKPLVAVADVANEEQVRRAVEGALSGFGAVDVLINSAGTTYFTPMSDTTQEQWDQVVDSNLKGVFLLCKHVMPHMLSRGRGDIVNIASIAAHQGFENATAYCAAKHGVLGFSRALALEVRKRGVRVITVSPGSVDTPLWDRMESSPDRARMLRAEDVAESVVAALTISPTATVDELVVMPRDGVL